MLIQSCQLFPMMLVGVVSFNVLRVMDPADERALGVLFVGYFFQGIGSMVTLLYLAVYFLRIMTVRSVRSSSGPFFTEAML